MALHLFALRLGALREAFFRNRELDFTLFCSRPLRDELRELRLSSSRNAREDDERLRLQREQVRGHQLFRKAEPLLREKVVDGGTAAGSRGRNSWRGRRCVGTVLVGKELRVCLRSERNERAHPSSALIS